MRSTRPDRVLGRTLGDDSLPSRTPDLRVSPGTGDATSIEVAMMPAGPIAKRRDEIASQVARGETILDEVKYHIVEQCRHHLSALVTVESELPRLIPQ